MIGQQALNIPGKNSPLGRILITLTFALGNRNGAKMLTEFLTSLFSRRKIPFTLLALYLATYVCLLMLHRKSGTAMARFKACPLPLSAGVMVLTV